MISLRHRWYGHKHNYKDWLADPINIGCVSIYPSFKEHGIENFKILLIKTVQVVDAKHLTSYEQLEINKRKNCVNKVNPLSPGNCAELKKAYSKAYHKVYHAENYKEYYEINKETIKTRAKNYHNNNKESISIKKKEYRKKNKEKINARDKKYYEKYKSNSQTKYTCICGSELSKGAKSRHEKTLKHSIYVINNA